MCVYGMVGDGEGERKGRREVCRKKDRETIDDEFINACMSTFTATSTAV
jgi:hypothetical protein